LHIPVDLVGERVLSDAAVIAEAAESSHSRTGEPQEVIGEGIAGVISREIDDAVLAAALIVANHQVREIAADFQRMRAPDPGDRFAAPVIDVVLDDVRAVSDKAAAGARKSGA